MATDWPDNEPLPGGGPVNRLQLPDTGPGWPARLSGYAKTLAALLGTVPAAVVVTWLQSAGVTHMPAWLSAAIPVMLGIVAVLFGPRNKP
jgi:hypothetical protein